MDLWIKNGSVVLLDEVRMLDIGVKDGRIVLLCDPAAAAEAAGWDRDKGYEVDASGLVVMAGLVDAHVHLNEPGLAEWEGFACGSAALAAGGCTTYIDMPLNGIPPTTAVASLSQKLAAAEGQSYVDYAIWGGLVPSNLEQIAPLQEAGVVGFKAFMSEPGGDHEDAFQRADDLTLWEGMQRIAERGGILALHAESETLTASLSARMRAEGRLGAADFAASRPIIAEIEAVNRALFMAEQAGCRLHFVHISSSAAIQLITAAKARGMDVTVETCPHYLCLTTNDMEQMGAVAKCAPPLRSLQEQALLWQALAAGEIDWIASDHSPSPWALKESADFFAAWGGISGAQSSLELLVDEGHLKRNMPLPMISRLLSYNPASRFGLHPRKGEIRVGADADLTLLDLNQPYVLQSKELLQRHKHSPYVGRSIGCRVSATWSRGRLVYDREIGVCGNKEGIWIR